MSNIIEQSFEINIAALNLLGLYPPEKYSLMRKVYSVTLYIFFLILPTILGTMHFLSEQTSDIVQSNFMLIYFFTIGAFGFKTLPFLKNGQRLKECINYFGHPRFIPKSFGEKKFTEECVRVCRRNSQLYFYTIVVGAILWILQTILSGNDFPLTLWLPYDPLSNSLKYYTTFLFGLCVFTYNTLGGALMDPLLGGLVFHAISQLKILKYNLTHLDNCGQTSTEKDDSSCIAFEMTEEFLKRNIIFHNNILEFVAEYEECFSWSAFCQFLGSTFTICLSLIGFLLGSSTTSAIIKDLVSVSWPVLQIYFYCYYGTLLYEENNGLAGAVCMGPWYRYDVRIRKTLITIMERSKQPMIITFGKVVNLNLDTLVSVLKTSYSLIAVLNNY